MKEQNFLLDRTWMFMSIIGNLIQYPNFSAHYELYNYNTELAPRVAKSIFRQDAIS